MSFDDDSKNFQNSGGFQPSFQHCFTQKKRRSNYFAETYTCLSIQKKIVNNDPMTDNSGPTQTAYSQLTFSRQTERSQLFSECKLSCRQLTFSECKLSCRQLTFSECKLSCRQLTFSECKLSCRQLTFSECKLSCRQLHQF